MSDNESIGGSTDSEPEFFLSYNYLKNDEIEDEGSNHEEIQYESAQETTNQDENDSIELSIDMRYITS